MQRKLQLKQWRAYFSDRGVEEHLIDEYINYIHKLQRNNAAVVFEIEHLSILLNINGSALARMINAPEAFYRKFTIPKRSGGRRRIDAPYPSLLHCQNWIYQNVLRNQQVHDSAHGFVTGRSIKTNALHHLDKKALLKMDLKDFFPSISINWVVNLFHSIGYAHNVSYYLASLCCLDGRLSQGAATSPVISNILLCHFDERLSLLAGTYQLQYTRYADDLAFSGDYIPHKFSSLVGDVVCDYGLYVNDTKTKLHVRPGQRIVTGISVTGSTLKLPRKTKRALRQEIHQIRKFGFLSHASKNKIRNPNYLESLEGKFQFWLQVEEENEFAKQAIQHLRRIRQQSGDQ